MIYVATSSLEEKREEGAQSEHKLDE